MIPGQLELWHGPRHGEIHRPDASASGARASPRRPARPRRRLTRLEPAGVDVVQQLAEAIVQRLSHSPEPNVKTHGLTAAELAAALGVSRDWVYGHKAELGGYPLGEQGPGKRPRWGFDLETARAAMRARAERARVAMTAIEPGLRSRRRAVRQTSHSPDQTSGLLDFDPIDHEL